VVANQQSEAHAPTARDWALWLLDQALARAPVVFLVCLIISMPPVLPIIAIFQPPEVLWHILLAMLAGSFLVTCIATCLPWSGQRRLRDTSRPGKYRGRFG
jgi:hypothetical protein